jgi:hypothetical protein
MTAKMAQTWKVATPHMKNWLSTAAQGVGHVL